MLIRSFAINRSCIIQQKTFDKSVKRMLQWHLISNVSFRSSMICNPAGNYMFKVNNRNTRTRCEIYSKWTIKTQERRHWHRSGVFIVNFEHISHLALAFLFLTLSREMTTGKKQFHVLLKFWEDLIKIFVHLIEHQSFLNFEH